MKRLNTIVRVVMLGAVTAAGPLYAQSAAAPALAARCQRS